MSKITYCSIQEAWGIEPNIIKYNDENNDNENNINNDDNENNEIKYLENKIKNLEKKYNELLNNKINKNNLKENLKENFTNITSENNTIDIMILILIGIFVIYLIDNIYQLKK